MKTIGIGVLLLCLWGCQSQPETVAEQQEYNSSSWQMMIPESCMQFNDGCNNCRRADSGVAACTRKFCAETGKPVCLDPGVDLSDYRVVYYCDGGKSFSLSYGVYHRGDTDIELTTSEVMMADHQTQSSALLNRTAQSIGSHYEGEGLQLYLRGRTANVQKDGLALYSDCQVVSS